MNAVSLVTTLGLRAFYVVPPFTVLHFITTCQPRFPRFYDFPSKVNENNDLTPLFSFFELTSLSGWGECSATVANLVYRMVNYSTVDRVKPV